MRVLIPFAAERPKTRLGAELSILERREFAYAMLSDVLETVRATGHDPVILATESVSATDIDDGTGEEIDVGIHDEDFTVIVDDSALTSAVNDAIVDSFSANDIDDTATAVAIVMSDLALATPRVLAGFFHADGDLVVAPGRGGGTNALVIREPGFRVDYHGTSYLDHLRTAQEIGASVREFDSHRLATDIDEPADLTEVLALSNGAARGWLEAAGYDLEIDDGRVGISRT